MNQRDIQQVRRAAVLVNSLDAATAEALLRQLPPDQARRLQLAVERLRDVSDEERQQALAAVARDVALQAVAPQPSGADDDGSGDDGDPLLRPTSHDWNGPTDPRQRLARVSPWRLAQALATEDPQIQAAVLRRLPPRQAADVLQRLPESRRGLLLKRLEHLHAGDARVVDHLLSAVEIHVASQSANIEEELESAEFLDIVKCHAQSSDARMDQDAPMPQAAAAPPTSALESSSWSPRELCELNDADLARVLAIVEDETILAAISDPRGPLTARIMRCLPTAEATLCRQRLARLAHVAPALGDAARRRLCLAAARLAALGRLSTRSSTASPAHGERALEAGNKVHQDTD